MCVCVVCERLSEQVDKRVFTRSARLNIVPRSMFGITVSVPSHTSGPSSQKALSLIPQVAGIKTREPTRLAEVAKPCLLRMSQCPV